jgi:glycosyltransferase involved in cell wall biosynthesis
MKSEALRPPRFVHIFPSFGIGGVPLRMARVINHFGSRWRHAIVALDGNLEAARNLEPRLGAELRSIRQSKGAVLRTVLDCMWELKRFQPDLLLTYNWGAIEWAMANRVWPVSEQIHFEAGFGKEEAERQIPRRVLFRRWALARCRKVVVPSRHLYDIARRVWRLPDEQIVYLPNGVDVARFVRPPAELALTRRPGESIIGSVAPLRPEKNVGRLLRVFARLAPGPALRLVVAGDGVERPALEALSRHLGIADRVTFLGQVRPEAVLHLFDVFALSSDTEQMPNALIEAMAAGRAVAAVDIGDVKAMVCEANRSFIVGRDDEAGFAASLARLLADASIRHDLGRANHDRASEEFSQEKMFAAYAEVFGCGRGIASRGKPAP